MCALYCLWKHTFTVYNPHKKCSLFMHKNGQPAKSTVPLDYSRAPHPSIGKKRGSGDRDHAYIELYHPWRPATNQIRALNKIALRHYFWYATKYKYSMRYSAIALVRNLAQAHVDNCIPLVRLRPFSPSRLWGVARKWLYHHTQNYWQR